MKCANCPANVDNPDSSIVNKYPDGLCKVGVNYKKKYGCQYTREQVDRWIAKRYPKPRTNQDALIEKWSADVDDMAYAMVNIGFDGKQPVYSYHVGKADPIQTNDYAEAVMRQIAWLLSPAEDGK